MTVAFGVNVASGGGVGGSVVGMQPTLSVQDLSCAAIKASVAESGGVRWFEPPHSFIVYTSGISIVAGTIGVPNDVCVMLGGTEPLS